MVECTVQVFIGETLKGMAWCVLLQDIVAWHFSRRRDGAGFSGCGLFSANIQLAKLKKELNRWTLTATDDILLIINKSTKRTKTKHMLVCVQTIFILRDNNIVLMCVSHLYMLYPLTGNERIQLHLDLYVC